MKNYASISAIFLGLTLVSCCKEPLPNTNNGNNNITITPSEGEKKLVKYKWNIKSKYSYRQDTLYDYLISTPSDTNYLWFKSDKSLSLYPNLSSSGITDIKWIITENDTKLS